MNTIKNNIEKLYIIKKSKFITKLFFVENKNMALNILKKAKEEYKDATHVCFAYIIDNDIKYSDDKEPSNTAGMPIYSVLKNNNLNHVLAIVVRYFGGIKLGASILTRTYGSCVKEALVDNICEEKNGYIIKISFKYDNLKDIDYILKEYNIINKNYDDLINYEVEVDNLELIKSKLNNLTECFIVLKETIIKG